MTFRGYQYRIYPNKIQEEQLWKNIGCARKVYNLILADKINNYEKFSKGKITKDELKERDKKLTPKKYKSEFEFLKEADSQALSQSHQNLNNAYSQFFKRLKKNSKSAGFPKFKSKNKNTWSYSSCTTSNNIRLENGKLVLPKISGGVKIAYHREFYGAIKKATVTKRRSGKWFVTLLVDDRLPAPSMVEPKTFIGLDLGLQDYLITSDGEFFDNPRIGRNLRQKLAKEQRKLSKKREIAKKKNKKLEDCSNYQKQRIKVARIYEKVTNQRQDFLHKLSSMIIKNHDFIATETLRPANMVKNRKLSYSISDASWSTFIEMLEYKALWDGKMLVKIDSFFPSSQLCSECGVNSGKKPLHVREWTCSHCGIWHDRDVNAARNILQEGVRVLNLQPLE